MSGGTPSTAVSFEDTAAAIDQIVVLLRAGLDIDAVMARAGGERRTHGLPWADGGVATSPIAALLEMCRLAGAPIAPALERESAVLTELGRAAREVEVAAAGPRATARIVGLLPLAGLLLSFFLGFDVVAAVTGSVVGILAAAAGVALTIAGGLWSRRIVRSATPVYSDPGLLHELVGVGLSGGLGPEASLRAARPLASRAVTAAEDEAAGAVADIERLIELGRSSGASLRPLVHAQASLLRRRRSMSARLAAERLATTLLVPLGVCALPAFVLLGVVPALLAIVSSTVI